MTCNVILCIFDSQLGNRVFSASFSNRYIWLVGPPNWFKFDRHNFTLPQHIAAKYYKNRITCVGDTTVWICVIFLRQSVETTLQSTQSRHSLVLTSGNIRLSFIYRSCHHFHCSATLKNLKAQKWPNILIKFHLLIKLSVLVPHELNNPFHWDYCLWYQDPMITIVLDWTSIISVYILCYS